MTVQLFPEVDIHPVTKLPKSPFPAYYFTERINDLKESIRQGRLAIEKGWIQESRLPQTRAEIAVKEEMLSKILDTIPKVNAMELDKLASLHAEASDLLKPWYFSRSDMHKGVADAHEEAMRMLDPIIEVRGDLYNLCKGCGVQITKGRVSRDELGRVWKILGKVLGKNTNTEILRPD